MLLISQPSAAVVDLTRPKVVVSRGERWAKLLDVWLAVTLFNKHQNL